LSAPPETFPKQKRIKVGGFGNWLRLPGRHHSREHWSTVWDGARWLDGAEAVAFMLTLAGDSPSLLPPAPPEPVAPPPPARPVHVLRVRAGRADLRGRIAAYMRRLPNGGEGTGRDDTAFNFASFLVRDLMLSDTAALSWLALWDRANSPPKGEARLR